MFLMALLPVVVFTHWSGFLEWYNHPKMLIWGLGLFAGALSLWKTKRTHFSADLVALAWIGLSGLLFLFPTSWPYYQVFQLSYLIMWGITLFWAASLPWSTREMAKTIHWSGAVIALFSLAGWISWNVFKTTINSQIPVNFYGTSSIGNTAYTGQCLVISIPFTIFLLFDSWKRYRTKNSEAENANLTTVFIYGFIFVLKLTILFTCKSRSTYIGLAASMTTAMFVFFPRNIAVKRVIPSIIVLFGLFMCFPSSRTKFLEVNKDLRTLMEHPQGWGITSNLSNTYSRIAFNLNGAKIASTRPWFGIGPGQWIAYYPLFSFAKVRDPEFNDGNHVAHPHDEYMNFLSERGLIGFLATLFILGIFVARLGPGIPLIAATGFATQALFEFNLMNPASGCLFAVLLGAGFRSATVEKPFWQKFLIPYETRDFRIIFLCFIPLLWPIFARTLGNYYTGQGTRAPNPTMGVALQNEALSYNPFEIEAYQSRAQQALNLVNAPQHKGTPAQKEYLNLAINSVSPTRMIVPFFPHPYQNSARLWASAGNLDRTFKYFRTSEMILSTTLASPIELGRISGMNEAQILDRMAVTLAEYTQYKAFNFPLVDRCWKTWAKTKDIKSCSL